MPTPLHPQALKLLDRFAQAGILPVSQQTPFGARRSGLRLMDMLNHEAGSCAILRQLNTSGGETVSSLSSIIGLPAPDVAERLQSLQATGAVFSKPGPADEAVWTMRLSGRRRTFHAGGTLDRLILADSAGGEGEGLLLDAGPNYTLSPTLDVRLYRPQGSEQQVLPVVMFVHGGGWVIGSISAYDATCRTLTERSGCAVLSLNYRLAPEHPFPAAVEDTRTALRWLLENSAGLCVDTRRLAVMGDSVGAGLAAVTALQAHQDDSCRVAMQVLLYPVTDATMSLPSYAEHAHAPLLSRADMQWYYGHYAPPPGDWRASPLQAPDLSGSPPTLLVTVGHDPVRDEGLAYGERLASAGVEVVHREYDSMFHGFFNFFTAIDLACDAHDLVAGALRQRFDVR